MSQKERITPQEVEEVRYIVEANLKHPNNGRFFIDILSKQVQKTILARQLK